MFLLFDGWRPSAFAAAPDPQTKATFDQLMRQLAQAQGREDEAEIVRLASQGRQLLGDLAGVPEVADEFRPVPRDAAPLTVEEARQGFAPYLKLIERDRWWRVGLDPTQTQHLPREVASVIAGCTAAARAKLAGADAAIKTATEAGDYLLWTQQQAGRGLIPFPALRNGQGRVFEVAERFFRRAEKAGQLDKILHNGWMVDDLGDGGLQFDNGLCGVALFELHAATGEARFRDAAVAIADWAVGRPVVPNWNYNSFSLYLLAKAYGATGDKRCLEAAKKKARLGVYPGQMPDGKYAGRWADPHNARPAYHYIMVRGVAALLAALSADDPDRAPAIRCLRLALRARNPEFSTQGISTVDSAVDALLTVKALPAASAAELGDCQTDAALDALGRYAASGYRERRPVFSPGVWGPYLEYLVAGGKGLPR